MFYDQPTMPPQVNFYNQDGRSSVEMFFRPNLNSSYDTGYLFKTLVDSDDVVSEKLSLSSDNIYGTVFKSDYFTGRYEIYRLDRPPLDISEFADNFLTEVDVTSTVKMSVVLKRYKKPHNLIRMRTLKTLWCQIEGIIIYLGLLLIMAHHQTIHLFMKLNFFKMQMKLRSISASTKYQKIKVSCIERNQKEL